MIGPKFASAAALALAGTLLWAQAPASFVTIDVPGAVSTGSLAAYERLRINPQGQIVGGYFDTLGKGHGFLLSDGNFATVDYPGAVFTTLCDISPTRDMVGVYQDTSLVLHGFLLSNGNLSTIDVPGATPATLQGQQVLTLPLGMSPEGDVGGVFPDGSGHFHGFVLSGGTFTQIDFPGAVFTSVQALKAGRIVGAEVSGGRVHAYVLTNGTFTEFDFPGAVNTAPIDINLEGTIVGEYVTPDGKTHGYKLEAGQFTTVDVPGAVFSFASGISSGGTMVGKYETPDGKFHGFELPSTILTGALADASNYALLYEGNGGHNLSISNVTINGNVGVGGTGVVQFSGPGAINGTLSFSAANTGQFHNTSGNNAGPTSVNYNQSSVMMDLANLGALSSSVSGGTDLAIANGGAVVDESSGQLETINGVTCRVFKVTSYSANNTDVLTINGDGSGAPVVFNFAFNSNVNLSGTVVFGGAGLTSPDQVLFNFQSSGKNISLNNNGNAAFQGIILAPNDNLSMSHANFNGRLFGGDSGDMQIVSGDTIKE